MVDFKINASAKVVGNLSLDFETRTEVDELIEAFSFVRERLPDSLSETMQNFEYSLRELSKYMFRAERGVDIDSTRSD